MVHKPVFRVENVIPEIVKHGRVKLIRPRPRDDRNLSAGRTAKFGRVSGCLYTELLHRIDRDKAVGPALRAEAKQCSSCPIARYKARGCTDVGANAVHHPVVGTGALPIDAELPPIVRTACRKNYAGREVDQSLKASAVQRQIFRELTIHDRADRGRLGVDEGCATLNGHGLGHGAYGQVKIDSAGIQDIQHDVRFYDGLEAYFRNLEAVASRRNGG